MSYFKGRLSNKEIGALGERIAVQYLTKNAFRIIRQNFSAKVGEVDIIAKKGGVIHFVEVKTVVRNTFSKVGAWGYIPEENVHKIKCAHIVRTAEYFLMQEGGEDITWQVDVITVTLEDGTGRARIKYLPQVA